MHGEEAKEKSIIYSTAEPQFKLNAMQVDSVVLRFEAEWHEPKQINNKKLLTCDPSQISSASSRITDRSISRTHVGFDGEKQRCIRLQQ